MSKKVNSRHIFSIVVITLFLSASVIVACGQNTPSPDPNTIHVAPTVTATNIPTGTASPTDSTTQAPTPAPTPILTPIPPPIPTPAPKPKPTPPPIPIADPSNFSISIRGLTLECPSDPNTTITSGTSDHCNYSVGLYNLSATGSVSWSSVSIIMDKGNKYSWLSFSGPHSKTLQPNERKTYTITVSVSKKMPADIYTGHIRFTPDNDGNHVDVNLTITPASAPTAPTLTTDSTEARSQE